MQDWCRANPLTSGSTFNGAYMEKVVAFKANSDFSGFSGSTFNGAYMEKAVAFKANFT
ncbi:hypothetical protein RYX36_004099, partial [Vicia faba]